MGDRFYKIAQDLLLVAFGVFAAFSFVAGGADWITADTIDAQGARLAAVLIWVIASALVLLARHEGGAYDEENDQ